MNTNSPVTWGYRCPQSGKVCSNLVSKHATPGRRLRIYSRRLRKFQNARSVGLYSSSVEAMLPSNSGPSFRPVVWSVPFSAFIFLSSEIVGPTPSDSGGASTLTRVKSVLQFAKDTALLSCFIPNAAVTCPIAPLMGYPLQWTTSRVVD
jgi:hypothetical protein